MFIFCKVALVQLVKRNWKAVTKKGFLPGYEVSIADNVIRQLVTFWNTSVFSAVFRTFLSVVKMLIKKKIHMGNVCIESASLSIYRYLFCYFEKNYFDSGLKRGFKLSVSHSNVWSYVVYMEWL